MWTYWAGVAYSFIHSLSTRAGGAQLFVRVPSQWPGFRLGHATNLRSGVYHIDSDYPNLGMRLVWIEVPCDRPHSLRYYVLSSWLHTPAWSFHSHRILHYICGIWHFGLPVFLHLYGLDTTSDIWLFITPHLYSWSHVLCILILFDSWTCQYFWYCIIMAWQYDDDDVITDACNTAMVVV